MTSALCRACGKEKDSELDFYHNRRVCKACCISSQVARQKTPAGRIKQAAARSRYNSSEHGAAKNKAYRESPIGRESQRRGQKKFREGGGHAVIQDRYYAKFPEKKAAKELLRQAVKSGRKIKPDHCSECGQNTDLHGHHTDYFKPLDVQWLCQPCHVRAHHGE